MEAASWALGLAGVVKTSDPDDLRRFEMASRWIVLSPSYARIAGLIEKGGWKPLQRALRPSIRPWTDERSSPLTVMRF